MSLPQIPLHSPSAIDILFLNKQTDSPNNPIKHQKRPRPRAHLLAPIHAPPRIHRRQTTHEAPPPKVEHGRVPDVRERAEVHVLEGRRDGLVAEGNVVRLEDRALLGDLGELLAEVFALLGGYLGGLRRRRLMKKYRRGGRGARQVEA